MKTSFERPTTVVLGAILALIAAVALCACSPSGPEQARPADESAQQSFENREAAAQAGETHFNGRFTFEELLEDNECDRGVGIDGAFGQGGYVVGEEGAPGPGTYVTEGGQEEASSYFVYRPSEKEEGAYELLCPFTYFGPAFVVLEEGQALIFKPASDAETLRLARDEPLGVSAPYLSGTYRVGTDIPAGTYVATAEEQSAKAIADLLGNMTPQVNVYGSLAFGDEDPLLKEGLPRFGEDEAAFTFTVEEGRILELFGCTAQTL